MDTLIKIFKGDRAIWFIFLFLCIISLVEVFSAGSRLTYQTGNYLVPLRQHAAFLFCGLILVLFVLHIPYRWFQLFPIILLPLSFIFLVVALVSGSGVNDAARWITLLGIRFQPSELAKMAMVIFAASILAKKQGENQVGASAFKIIAPALLLFCGLIFSENLSTCLLLFMVIYIMMFIGRVSFKTLTASLGILLLPIVFVFLFVIIAPGKSNKVSFLHRADMWVGRIENFMSDRKKVPAVRYDIANNEQVGHARIAIATSSLFGKGPGNSIQRDFLSEAASDFIFAIIIEEIGLVGGFFVLFLYICLLIRAGRIAKKCDRAFPAFLIIGIALMMVSQALLNMMVAVGLFPVTGQPLPLISKGGTSTLINCIYIGMMLSISRYTRRLDRQREHDKSLKLEVDNQAAEPTAEILNEDMKLK